MVTRRQAKPMSRSKKQSPQHQKANAWGGIHPFLIFLLSLYDLLAFLFVRLHQLHSSSLSMTHILHNWDALSSSPSGFGMSKPPGTYIYLAATTKVIWRDKPLDVHADVADLFTPPTCCPVILGPVLGGCRCSS